MEEDISNWKNLWEEEKSNSFDVKSLIHQLTELERKEKKERVFVMIAFPVTLLILGLLLPIFESGYFIIAISCIGIAMLILLLQIYKSKLKNSNEASFDNQAYIKKSVKSLKGKMRTTSRYMWLYTFLLLLGLNVGYMEVLKNVNSPIRIAIHAGLSLAILVFMYFGIQRRVKKNKRDILPLIQKLKTLMD